MKVVFFNRFFFPDTSATSQILSDLAFHFASFGIEVEVVTSDSSDGALPSLDSINGVTVHRVVKVSSTPKGLARRAAAYAGYHIAARRFARRHVGPGDIVILKTDPPMLGASVGPIVVRKGATLVNWLQDLFPEVAQRHGVPGTRGVAGSVLRRLRNRSLRLATRNVAIAESMATQLATLGAGNVEVIHNWADGSVIKPCPPEGNPLRKKWALEGVFVVGYSGNLGRVHEFETLLGAARVLKDTPGIRFLIVGRGPRLAEVKERARRDQLSNVQFEPHQERESLSDSLGAVDVHVSTLYPDFEGLVHPSKLYGVMAAGRPTIFIGSRMGESARILDDTGAGISISTGNVDGLAAAIRALQADPARVTDMGSRARAAFSAQYDMPVALEKWMSLLGALEATRS